MATFDSDQYTLQTTKATTRSVSMSERTLTQSVRYAQFTYTLAGTEANGDIIQLGYIGVPKCYVLPHLSSLRDTGGAGDVDFDAKLNALVDGTSTDLSGVAALDNNRAAFADIAASPLLEIDQDDLLRLIVSDASIGAVTAGETIAVEVAYISETL